MTGDSGLIGTRTAVWASALKFLALITALLANILIRPPALYDQDLDGQYVPLMNAVGIVLLLFFMVFSKRAANLLGSTRASLIALGIMAVAVASLIGYMMVARSWSCSDGQGVRLIVGSEYLAAAVRDMRDNGWTTCTEIIDNSAGALGTIWDDDEISTRFFALFSWFIGNAVLFMSSIFLAIEVAICVLGRDISAAEK